MNSTMKTNYMMAVQAQVAAPNTGGDQAILTPTNGGPGYEKGLARRQSNDSRGTGAGWPRECEARETCETVKLCKVEDNRSWLTRYDVPPISRREVSRGGGKGERVANRSDHDDPEWR